MAADALDRVFSFLRQRKTAYRLAFGSPAGNEVLMDLVRFCRGIETCVIPGDADRTLVLEGRREVLLRINEHLNLSDEQLFALYNRRNILRPADAQ